MESLYNQTIRSIEDLQMVADNIFDYNSGLCKRKVPLDVIQADVGDLTRALVILHSDIGERIRNGTQEEKQDEDDKR